MFHASLVVVQQNKISTQYLNKGISIIVTDSQVFFLLFFFNEMDMITRMKLAHELSLPISSWSEDPAHEFIVMFCVVV